MGWVIKPAAVPRRSATVALNRQAALGPRRSLLLHGDARDSSACIASELLRVELSAVSSGQASAAAAAVTPAKAAAHAARSKVLDSQPKPPTPPAAIAAPTAPAAAAGIKQARWLTVRSLTARSLTARSLTAEGGLCSAFEVVARSVA